MIDYIYDIETYPNCFTFDVISTYNRDHWLFEISDYANQSAELINFLDILHANGDRLVGFNNIHFDYPVLHEFITRRGAINAKQLYDKAMSIINGDGFSHQIWEDQRYITQVDLFKIHHFDNPAKSTSLKAIEFAMRMESVEDLPFPVGTVLSYEQVQILKSYNKHDSDATIRFYYYTLPMIKFREELSVKYGVNFLNHNDTKIGKEIFISKLESQGIDCFERSATGGKKPIQTIRNSIDLSDAVFDWITFNEPEFRRIKEWFQAQTITETKGVFKNLSCTVKGFKFDFGLGGIHGSLNNTIVKTNDEYVVLDIDVASYYPRLAAVNKLYPEHLTEAYCPIYDEMFIERRSHSKGTPENALFKLALNGVYGNSKNKYSPFYDPLYTMRTTINGQLLLCALSERLLEIPYLTLIQVNTDGLTVRVKHEQLKDVKAVMKWWEGMTQLELEDVEYSAMYIRDVNNYIAVSHDGKVKRKGAYAHVFNPTKINIGNGDLDWHKNHGGRIIPMTAEYCLIDGMITAEELVTSHDNLYDFCLSVKVPRTSQLLARDGDTHYSLPNFTRYYISQGGYSLVKMMPPLKGKTEPRPIGVDVGYTVNPCNKITDAVLPVNFDYYIQKINDLVQPLKELQ